LSQIILTLHFIFFSILFSYVKFKYIQPMSQIILMVPLGFCYLYYSYILRSNKNINPMNHVILTLLVGCVPCVVCSFTNNPNMFTPCTKCYTHFRCNFFSVLFLYVKFEYIHSVAIRFCSLYYCYILRSNKSAPLHVQIILTWHRCCPLYHYYIFRIWH
jgi:hypothetical protein